MNRKIKVMIVDDSALVRQVVGRAIAREPEIEIIATAQDPLFALAKMQADWPDVLVVDIEMPRMDGLTFLKKIMAERPTPVIICSSLAEAPATAWWPSARAVLLPVKRGGCLGYRCGIGALLAAAVQYKTASRC